MVLTFTPAGTLKAIKKLSAKMQKYAESQEVQREQHLEDARRASIRANNCWDEANHALNLSEKLDGIFNP